MTETVKKGAGRRGHNLRTQKAAQRTPLPPRAGRTTDAAARKAVSPSKAPPAKATQAKAQAKPAAKVAVSAPTKPAGPMEPGQRKAEEFAQVCNALGWVTTVVSPSAGMWVAGACRETPAGNEVITASWINGVVTENNLPMHSVGNSNARKLRNVATARQAAAIPAGKVAPITVRVPKAPRPQSTRVQRARAVATDGGGELPALTAHFAEDTPDAEILAEVNGRTVIWRNSLSNTRDQDTVPRDGKHTRLTANGSGVRTLEFNSVDGFRAVRVAAIEFVR